jgi:hypothetical protein
MEGAVVSMPLPYSLINDCRKLKSTDIAFDDTTFMQRFKKIYQLVQKLKRGTYGRVIAYTTLFP